MTDRLGPTVFVGSTGPYGLGTVRGMPLTGYVTSVFGEFSDIRRRLGVGPHRGVDLSAAIVDSPLCAMAPGKVRWVGYDDINGNYVSVTTATGGEYQYLHMRDPALVRVGQVVRRGDQLGVMGTTGRSTGPHVHVNYATTTGMPWQDSLPLFTDRGMWQGRVAPQGVSAVLWNGGTVEQLDEELRHNRIQSCTVYIDGEPLVYVTGAPAFANGDFTQRFQEGVPDRTILILKPEGA